MSPCRLVYFFLFVIIIKACCWHGPAEKRVISTSKDVSQKGNFKERI